MTDSDPLRPPFPSRRDRHRHRQTSQESRTSQPSQRVPRPSLGGTPAGGVELPTRAQRRAQLSAEARRNAARQQRKRRTRRKIRTFIVIIAMLAVLGGAAYVAVSALKSTGVVADQSDDYPGPGSGSVEVTINKGEIGSDIGAKLVEADVVKSVAAFNRAFDANKAASGIKPGTYQLKKQMSASGAVAALLDETNRTENTVTVTPGSVLKQTLDKMREVSGFSDEAIQEAINNPEALGLPAQAQGNLEGWLEPGSYEVSQDDTPADLLSEMIQARVDALDQAGVPEDQRQTVLIKASIVEREMHLEKYMPMVARVIENRLKDTEGETRGQLKMDSTVLYGVGKYGGVPTKDDLANDNPYNTYLIKGLPPGPIASPSSTAINAVLNPEPGDWLYFVTIDLDTGETLFATTNEEQEKNKVKFDEYCEANPGKC